MTIMLPQQFEVVTFQLKHRASMYQDYANYLVEYAQTHAPSKNEEFWVEAFDEEDKSDKAGKSYRNVRVSDALEKAIERHYSEYRIQKKMIKRKGEKKDDK